MGKFSYDDYMNLKKKGLVSWDDDLIKGHSKNLNDFVKGTSSLTEESFDDNVSKLRELEDQHRYVQTYINSLEGSGSYNGAKRSFDSIDATLNKAKGFYGQFKDSKAYGEALKQQKEAQAAEKQAKAQADEYRYNSKYQDFSYDELTRASKSTAPNLDESERNWLKKAAQNKATAQEYYEKELAPIEARMKELDEQYMQTHYSTPEMQNEYAKLRKQLDEKENIYKQKKDNQAAVNNAVEKREESARLNANLSRKYLTPATGGMSDEQAAKENESYLNRLIEGFYNSNDDKEREWIKERIKSGGFGSKAVEKAMNELYERSDDEAKRISGEYVYDGYETKKKDIIQSSQKKYADAAYMLENVLHPIKRAETSSKYMSLSGNKDFEANSNPDMIAGFTKREDRGELDNKRYMTDDEYKVYTYVYNTQGPEKAEEFFKSIEPELNKKMTEAQAQKEADLANSGLGGAIVASVKSLGYNFISGGGFIEDVVNYAAHKEVDTNSFLNLPANLSNAARQTVQKNIDNPVGQWIYGTTMSIADNAINMLVGKGVGKVAGLAGASASTVNNVAANATSIIMGSQVATQTVIDCKDKGLSDGQALGLGLIHGLVEHITEKVSIESILSDPRTFKQALKKSFVSEGSEEVAANWLDRAADALIMGDKSKERQDFENFKAQGMSDIEAFGQVMLGCLGEDASAFFAGGISGVAMSGTSHAFNAGVKKLEERSANKSLSRTYQAIAKEASKSKDFDEKKKELIEQAKSSGDEKARKMAESFERTIENNGGKLDSIKVEDVGNMLLVLDVGAQKQEVIDSAKNAGDTEVEKMAAGLEEKVKKAGGDYSAVTVWETLDLMKAVENVKQYKSSVGLNTDTTESTENEEKEPTAAESMVKAGGGYEAQEIRDSYTDSGLKSKRIGGVNLNAFGAKYADGIEATSRSDKNVRFQIIRIHSSARENNEDFNTVVLETSDGKFVNADEVTLKSTALDTLLRSADYFDTNGARGLLANYEGYEKYCKRNGREADVHEYLKLYRDAYSFGRNNIRYESLKKVGSTRFNSIARAIGIEQAENALNTGANDVDVYFKNENNAIQRLRMPGRRNAADSSVELDVNESFEPGYSDDQVMLLEAVAKKTGRSIVLTDKLESDVKGVFGKDGKIYINANMANSDYMISIALHEAVHGLRDSAPAEYNALEKFVVNYLVERGESVDEMLDDIKIKWKQKAPTEGRRREELVAQTVMALASNERALKTAIECEANMDLLKKALDAIKRIAQGVRTWIEGIKKGDRITGAHNKQAQPWIEDVKALEKLAKLFSKYMDEQRVAVQETTQERNQGGVRYSFGGERAKSADKTSLATAKQLDADGKDSEEIRQKTGWHKGYDGKWRFEIDDSELEVDLSGVSTARKPIVQQKELMDKMMKGELNEDEEQLLDDISDYSPEYINDIVKHDKLFAAYPQLGNIRFEFNDGIDGLGSYNSSERLIKLNSKLREMPGQLKSTLAHELQHAIQHEEGFAEGSSPFYWAQKYSPKEIQKIGEEKTMNILNSLSKETAQKYLRYNELDYAMGELLNKENFDEKLYAKYEAESDRLYKELWDKEWFRTLLDIKNGTEIPRNFYRSLYFNTAGEIEARDVQQRLNLNAEQRQKKRPDIDRDEVVFSGQNGESFEIKRDINGNEFVEIDKSIYDNSNGRTIAQIISNIIINRFHNLIYANGREFKINRKTNDEWSYSKEAKSLMKNKPVYYDDKLHAIANADEILTAAKNWIGEKKKHKNKNKIVEFARGKILYKVGNNGYIADVIVGTYADGSAILYDLVNIGSIKITEALMIDTDNSHLYSKESASANNNLTHGYENVNTTEGRKSVDDTIKDNDLRFAVDDEITDDLFSFDGDLFEEDNTKYLDEYIKTSPQEAVLSMYNSLAKTGESVVRGFKGVKLDEGNYLKAAKRLMKHYQIKQSLNPGIDSEIAQRIKEFVTDVNDNPNANYNEALNVLANDCKSFLLMSGDYDDTGKEIREQILGEIRGSTILLRPYEESQILESFGGMKNLKRAFFGKVNVGYERNKKKGGTYWYIEELVEHIREQLGKAYADESAEDSFEGWKWLDNMLNNVLQPKIINPYLDGEMSVVKSIDSAAAEMALDITNELITEKTTAAARMKSADKKVIAELRKKEKSAASAQRAMSRAKIEKFKTIAREEKRKRIELSEHYSDRLNDSERKRIEQNRRYREWINSVKDQNRSYRNLIFDETATIREKYVEAREKVRYRKLLAKEYERMVKRLDGKANNNEYIPERLKAPIKNLLELFEVVPEDGKNLPGYWAQYRNLKDVGQRIEDVFKQYSSLSKEMSDNYQIGDSYNADALAYDRAVEAALEEMSELVKGKNVYSMSAEQLRLVYEGMKMLDTQLRRAVEVIVDGKRTYIKELAEKAVDEVQSVHFNKGSGIMDLRNAAIATHLDPVRYGRFLSGYNEDAVIYKLFKDLHEGDKKRVRIMHKAFTELQRTLNSEFSNKELKALQTEDVEDFDFRDKNTGDRVGISRAVLLSIYLTDRQADGHRQLVNEKANHYTRLPDLKLMNRDKMPVIGDAYSSLTKAKQKATGEKSHEVRFSKYDLEQIRDYVEGDSKLFKLAEAVSSVFNGVIKDEINEVSLQRYGKMIATVKNYFPIKSDPSYAGKRYEVEMGDSVRNWLLQSRGFTKQRVHAENALMIDDVLNVFLRHVQETAEYCGMMIPVENFKRVYGKGNDDVILSKALRDKFGSSANHYIAKLMDDIQAPKNTLDENFLTRLHGNYMGAVLMINPGAAIKQFAAFPTAFKYFGVSNVTKAVPVSLAKGKSLVEKYSEYTPYMWYRENGNGTIIAEISRQLSLTGKTESWLDIMGKVDRFVVNSLLYAAEEHVRQTRSDLEFDSDEFKKEVARQFERAVDESQPNNMVTSKPQFVRNQALRMLSMNAFISQNMAMGNGIIDSGMELAARIHDNKVNKTADSKKAVRAAAVKFARHIIGVLLSGALLGLLNSLPILIIYHKWDDTKDEEGKTSLAKIAEKYVNDSLEAIAGAFAQGDYLYGTIKTLISGEGDVTKLEVMSLGTINDLAENVKKGDYWKAAALASDALGIPIPFGNNVQRLWRSAASYVTDLKEGNTLPAGLGDHTIVKNNGKLDTDNIGYYVADYVRSGNKEEAEKYINLWKGELMNQGKSEDEATQNIKNKLADVLAKTDDDVTDAFIAYSNGDYQKYDALYEKLHGYGFDQTDVEKAVNKVKKLIFKAMKDAGVESDEAKDDLVTQGFNEKAAGKLAEEYNKAPEEQPDDVLSNTGEGKKYKKADAFKAFASGDKEAYEDIKEYLVEKGKVEDGEKLDKDMQSMTYTGELIDSYLKALDAEYKDKSQKENREELKKQLLNIYGSWDKASAAIKKRQKQKQKK